MRGFDVREIPDVAVNTMAVQDFLDDSPEQSSR
jgi:hypothetical protein